MYVGLYVQTVYKYILLWVYEQKYDISDSQKGKVGRSSGKIIYNTCCYYRSQRHSQTPNTFFRGMNQ